MKCQNGSVEILGGWLILPAPDPEEIDSGVFCTPAQMRRLAAMLTRAADRIDAKRAPGRRQRK